MSIKNYGPFLKYLFYLSDILENYMHNPVGIPYVSRRKLLKEMIDLIIGMQSEN